MIKQLLLVLVISVVAACGGKKTPSTPTNKPTGSATTDNKMEGTGDKKPDADKKPEGGEDPCAVPPP